MPDRATVCGLFAALSLIVNWAVAAPAAAGVKVRLMAHCAPPARLVPQLLVWAKLEAFAPMIAIPEIVSEALPVLVRVTDWAALVVPTV